VIVRTGWKSRVVLHSEVAGIEFLAVPQYYKSIYQGTISHFEIIPCTEAPVRVRIWGSKRDGERIGQIVQLILQANPDAQLLNIN